MSTKTIQAEADVLNQARRLASSHGMYVVDRQEVRRGQPVTMYLLFRRLRYGYHGTLIGKRNSAQGLLKLVQLAKEAI